MKTAVLPPLFATLHLRPAGWRFGLRPWLPLFLLWLLLLTVLILALPLLLVACLRPAGPFPHSHLAFLSR